MSSGSFVWMKVLATPPGTNFARRRAARSRCSSKRCGEKCGRRGSGGGRYLELLPATNRPNSSNVAIKPAEYLGFPE